MNRTAAEPGGCVYQNPFCISSFLTEALFPRLLKKGPACAKAPARRQMRVEFAKPRLSGAPELLCRERFETVPYKGTVQQSCPVLDTGRDEGNPARCGTDGRFSADG